MMKKSTHERNHPAKAYAEYFTILSYFTYDSRSEFIIYIIQMYKNYDIGLFFVEMTSMLFPSVTVSLKSFCFSSNFVRMTNRSWMGMSIFRMTNRSWMGMSIFRRKRDKL
jgi:hypothetical protein